jgi:hypothetical protein
MTYSDTTIINKRAYQIAHCYEERITQWLRFYGFTESKFPVFGKPRAKPEIRLWFAVLCVATHIKRLINNKWLDHKPPEIDAVEYLLPHIKYIELARTRFKRLPLA